MPFACCIADAEFWNFSMPFRETSARRASFRSPRILGSIGTVAIHDPADFELLQLTFPIQGR